MDLTNKIIVSGIKPTSGEGLTLGNYIGALKNFVTYQSAEKLYIFIADLHALTLYNDPVQLRKSILNTIYTYLGVGLDLTKCIIFRQSDVPAHNQLEWILTCNTDLPDLLKMPQYKNYLATFTTKAVPTSILLYPSLMNADILLYDADYVPVGLDQKPHITLTRTVAKKFNKLYGETFKLPEALLPGVGAKVMNLSAPTQKMSKSDSGIGTIYLTDAKEIVETKFKKALTDSENKIYYDPENKPGVSNLLTIYASLQNISIDQAVDSFKGLSYKSLKEGTCSAVVKTLTYLQAKINEAKLQFNSTKLTELLINNANLASIKANNKIAEVYYKIGLR